MTRGFVPVRRIAALSVAITLVAAPIASAQSPNAAPPRETPANTALLSSAAFARLLQPAQADTAPAPVIADSPRPSLLRQGTAAVAREARAMVAKAPQQESWASRHKKALIWTTIVGVGLFVGFGYFGGMVIQNHFGG